MVYVVAQKSKEEEIRRGQCNWDKKQTLVPVKRLPGLTDISSEILPGYSGKE